MTAKEYLCPQKKSKWSDMSHMLTREHFEIIKDNIDENAVIAIVDINKMMTINDSYGHLVGDKVILAVYDSLANQFGASNVFRYGGDEFLIIEYDQRSFSGIRGCIFNKDLDDIKTYGVKIEWSMQMNLYRHINKKTRI